MSTRQLGPSAYALVAILAGLAASPPALAQLQSHVEFELTPGLAVPLNDFLSASATGMSVNVDSGPGFGLGVNLALDDWEFRYALSVLTTARVRVEWSPELVSEWNAGAESAGLDEVAITPNQADGGWLRDEDGSPLRIHHLALGYRVALWRSDLHVFIPVGLGMAITTSAPDTLPRSLYGLHLHTGIGLSWRIVDWFRIGAQLRYLFAFSENTTDVSQSSAVLSARVTGEALESAYHFSHILHLALSLSVEF